MAVNYYTTLDAIVRELIDQEGGETPLKYMRYLNIANAGLRELTYDILTDVKTVLLTVSNTMRVTLPAGYVDYAYIGVIGADGSVYPLGRKSNIVKIGSTNTLADIDTVTDAESQPEIEPTEFGRGGGQNENGYYLPTVDYDNWQMIFTSVLVGSQIYMEYISDGRVTDGNTIIHPYAEEALKAYIYWKGIQRMSGADPNDKMMARRDYFNEKRLSKARLNSFTKEEALQQIRSGFKQSPKL